MKQFIPLEDDWSLVEALAEPRLVPYQPGMHCRHAARERQGDVAGHASSNEENFFAPLHSIGRRRYDSRPSTNGTFLGGSTGSRPSEKADSRGC